MTDRRGVVGPGKGRPGNVGFGEDDEELLAAVVANQIGAAVEAKDVGGLSLVCSGCAETPHPHDAEHVPITGGLWGYIDHRGREIVPVRYSRDQAAARKDTLPHP